MILYLMRSLRTHYQQEEESNGAVYQIGSDKSHTAGLRKSGTSGIAKRGYISVSIS